jgi:hypothetical protein
MRLAQREGGEAEELPEPDTLPFEPDEFEFMYELWTLWAATDKRYLPSQLVPEMLSGYGRILTNLLEMESLYGKTKAYLKKQAPNG